MKNYQKISAKCSPARAFTAVLCAATVLCLAGCGTDRALVLVPESETMAEASEAAAAPETTASEGGFAADAGTGGQSQTICVHVCGAVVSPGVVELPAGSRACDALEAAGGLAADADERSVNLAAALEDGQQLYFPTAEEAEIIQESAAEQSAGLVNLNTADATQLCTLPGIGESRAAAIIAYREEHGGFASPEDIMQVSGIKTAAYEKIKAYITVKQKDHHGGKKSSGSG